MCAGGICPSEPIFIAIQINNHQNTTNQNTMSKGQILPSDTSTALRDTVRIKPCECKKTLACGHFDHSNFHQKQNCYLVIDYWILFTLITARFKTVDM